MYHLVTLYFNETDPVRFKIFADTGTGALIAALAFDWPLEQRKAFSGALIEPWTEGTQI